MKQFSLVWMENPKTVFCEVNNPQELSLHQQSRRISWMIASTWYDVMWMPCSLSLSLALAAQACVTCATHDRSLLSVRHEVHSKTQTKYIRRDKFTYLMIVKNTVFTVSLHS